MEEHYSHGQPAMWSVHSGSASSLYDIHIPTTQAVSTYQSNSHHHTPDTYLQSTSGHLQYFEPSLNKYVVLSPDHFTAQVLQSLSTPVMQPSNSSTLYMLPLTSYVQALSSFVQPLMSSRSDIQNSLSSYQPKHNNVDMEQLKPAVMVEAITGQSDASITQHYQYQIPHISMSQTSQSSAGRVVTAAGGPPAASVAPLENHYNSLQSDNFTLSSYRSNNASTTLPNENFAVTSHLSNDSPTFNCATQNFSTSVHSCATNPTESESLAETRKSNRLAIKSSHVLPKKRVFVPKEYNINEIWCEPCKSSYADKCSVHSSILVNDKVVLSQAWASLPSVLTICSVASSSEMGVFTKVSLKANTRFGPVIGQRVYEEDATSKILIPLENADGSKSFMELSDESQCNWMMFVRPATSNSEQNLVLYQHHSDIFFISCRDVAPKEELKVWYAQHYAARMGFELFTVSEEERAQDGSWTCFECDRSFTTSVLLDLHMNEHDDEANTVGDNSDEKEWKVGKPDHQYAKRRRGRPSKLMKELGEARFWSWKKRTTNLYLNKTLKKYQRRQNSDIVKRSISSLYRRRGKGISNTWVCLHCGLTFDNSSLLNIHTLTHAAEDVGMSELDSKHSQQPMISEQQKIDSNMLYDSFTCPVCYKEFNERRDLIEHTSEHAMPISEEKPHMCPVCYKNFTTADRLQHHMLCHGDDKDKPVSCPQCNKGLMSNAALACHLRIHSSSSHFECLVCNKGFSRGVILKEHVKVHEVNGCYPCPQCQQNFMSYKLLKKHIASAHARRTVPCPHCDKMFSRTDKLRLHMLRHSTERAFMCDICGKQFKRSDKLQEHKKRMHSLEKEQIQQAKQDIKSTKKKFVPKVQPTDFQSFLYKCIHCQLGFKRRGMLINHLVKHHPDVLLESVPELTLPILKPTRDFYCQYCEKTYKSSSKRKAHILKKHPGGMLPLSGRHKLDEVQLAAGINPYYSQTVGSVTSMPHSCEFCRKQYASRGKLLQHQRSKHLDLVSYKADKTSTSDQNAADIVTNVIHQGLISSSTTHGYTTQTTGPTLTSYDLLTQAMTELQQSPGDPARILTAQSIEPLTAIPPCSTTLELSSFMSGTYQQLQNLSNIPISDLKGVDVDVTNISDHLTAVTLPRSSALTATPNCDSTLQRNNWTDYVYQ